MTTMMSCFLGIFFLLSRGHDFHGYTTELAHSPQAVPTQSVVVPMDPQCKTLGMMEADMPPGTLIIVQGCEKRTAFVSTIQRGCAIKGLSVDLVIWMLRGRRAPQGAQRPEMVLLAPLCRRSSRCHPPLGVSLGSAPRACTHPRTDGLPTATLISTTPHTYDHPLENNTEIIAETMPSVVLTRAWFTQTVSRHKQRHKRDERALEVMQAADSGRNKCRGGATSGRTGIRSLPKNATRGPKSQKNT